MQNNDMIEKYVYAVVRNLSRDKREDVAAELRSLIDDMLTERAGSDLPVEANLRAVLTELGHPNELAARYGSARDDRLIGQPHYDLYKMIIKIVLLALSLGLVVAYIVAYSLGTEAFTAARLLELLLSILSASLAAFGAVTLVFALLYRKGVRLDTDEDFIDNLPDLPAEEERFTLGGVLPGIILNLILIVLVTVISRPGFAGMLSANGWYSFFNLEIVRSLSPYFIIVLALGIVQDIVKINDGRYTLASVILSAVKAVAGIWAAVVWLTQAQVLDQPSLQAIRDVVGEGGAELTSQLHRLPMIILAVIVFAYVLELGMTIYHYARRHSRTENA